MLPGPVPTVEDTSVNKSVVYPPSLDLLFCVDHRHCVSKVKPLWWKVKSSWEPKKNMILYVFYRLESQGSVKLRTLFKRILNWALSPLLTSSISTLPRLSHCPRGWTFKGFEAIVCSFREMWHIHQKENVNIDIFWNNKLWVSMWMKPWAEMVENKLCGGKCRLVGFWRTKKS